MEHIGDTMAKAKEIIRRMAERAADPEFQAAAARQAEKDAAVLAAQAETERKLRLLSLGIPMREWDALKNPEPSAAMDAARGFLESPRRCVFLTYAGPAGRGKTYAACWLVAQFDLAFDRAVAENRTRTVNDTFPSGGKYVLAADLVAAGTFGDGAAFWRELESVGVLAIDELGQEYRNGAMESSLFALLNKRFANQRKTILCTNMDAANFRRRYCPDPEDPLYDRLVKGGTWVNLPGESMRRHWTDDDREEAP